ncbi:AAA family ATPase [Ktedonospora formicarum]|uniref:Uncharacterized protein n=1 Tax=Ktedonospora formicarum TaxID=2778364 RepID=A0A8J3I8Z5_9CHLR|nr:AAA family ATPase [Ktedonospora formicarum]GHO48217.1 hypothetical protein KSX_63800 [Ktedonospora formicarum]
MENSTPDLTWLIEHILPKGELLIVQSPSCVGRSLLLLDWAFCHATGKPWFGHHVGSGSVAYCSSEKLQGLGGRARAWYTTYESEIDLPVSQTPISFYELGTLSDDNYFIATEQLTEEIAALPETPSLIVLDVLTTDERKARVLAYRLWQQFGTTVLLTSTSGTYDNIVQLIPLEQSSEQRFLLRLPSKYSAPPLQLRLQSVSPSDKDFPLADATSYIIECEGQQSA